MGRPERSEVQLHLGPFAPGQMRMAYYRLMHDVLGRQAPTDIELAGPWRSFSYFSLGPRCVANVDAAILPLVVDGEPMGAGAVGSVAVDPICRGRGFFRDLMREALAYCDAGSALTLLYTEEPAIYRAFGFREVPQHAFVGPAPHMAPSAQKSATPSLRDAACLRAALDGRAPVSMSCALLVDAPLFIANVADEDIRQAYIADHDAIVLYEVDDDVLTLVDIVGPAIPDLATILGALSVSARSVKTLFPPDRLGWSGEPIVEDTGLMIRGTVPAAMKRPFILPPTVEF